MSYIPTDPVDTTFAAFDARLKVLEAAAARPSFSVAPSITSDGTPQVGETLLGSDGTIVKGTVTARAWLLGGVAISGATGASYTPTQAGTYQYQVTATGSTGAMVTASSPAFTVAAAAPVAMFARAAFFATPFFA
jgi:hypothetical protein